GRGRHHPGMELRPTGHGDADAVIQCRGSVIARPGPGQNAYVNGTFVGKQTQVAAAVVINRPDVATAKAIAPDHLADGVSEFGGGKGHAQAVDAARGEEAFEVSVQPKHGGTERGVVATNPFEDAGAVMQPV